MSADARGRRTVLLVVVAVAAAVAVTLLGLRAIGVAGRAVGDETAGRASASDESGPTRSVLPSATPAPDGFSVGCPDPGRLDAVLTERDLHTGDLADFGAVTGAACLARDAGATAYDVEAPLTTAQAQLLAADLAARTTTGPQLAGRCTDLGPVRVVVLADDRGATVVRLDRSCTTEFAGGGTFWLAGPEAERVLDDVLLGPRGG